MQVFVKKSDLITDPVPVLAFYNDTPTMALDTHGSDVTLLVLPPLAIDQSSLPPKLTSDFRSQNMPMMVNNEAARRINLSFPDYMQRNCNADINTSTTKYGADSSGWPPDAQDRKADNDRGWSFIATVRQTADALATQTATTDPTDDSHWPVQIPPVYVEPVP